MSRLETDDNLPNFSEIKKVIDNYEDKMKHKESELERKRQALEHEDATRKQNFDREKQEERATIEEERLNSLAQVQKIAADVREEKDHWEAEKKAVEGTMSFGKIITLNVGGTRYTTSLSTLRKYPDSMLGAMFSGRHFLEPQTDGSFFIDRDGQVFRYVLAYLRDCNEQLAVAPTLSQETRLQLEFEAKFYQLPELEAVLQTVRCLHSFDITIGTQIISQTGIGIMGGGNGRYRQLDYSSQQSQLNVTHSPQLPKMPLNTTAACVTLRMASHGTQMATNTLFTQEMNFINCNLSGLTFRDCYFEKPVSFEGCVMQDTKFHRVGGLVTHKVHFTPWQVAQASFQPELLKALEDNGCIY